MSPRSGKNSMPEFWEQALDRAQLGVWDWNLLAGECFYSDTWARMLGYDPAELSNDPSLWLELIHPDDREAAILSGDRHLAGLTAGIETELRLRHKDGRWIWVLDRGGVIERDAGGRPTRMVGVQTDITRQKEAERQLEQVNVRFRLALAASGTGVWHYDMASQKSYWDARTREIFGVGDESGELSGDLWIALIHPDDRERTVSAHSSEPGSHEVTAVRYRIVRGDGEVRHIETLVRYYEAGEAGQILGTVRDITDEQSREAELAHAARHDSLTGLPNRAAFEKLLSEALSDPGRLPVAVLYIDLDYFKALNDFAGHAAGDEALKTIAACIRSCTPATGVAARLGGDEFTLFVPACEAARAEAIAASVLTAIRNADLGSGLQRLAASIGIAVVRAPMSSADALACADDACYASKAHGRNRYSLFSGHSGSVAGLNAARVASDLLDALEEGRLMLYGQEIFRLNDRPQPHAVEVLARLEGRDGRILPPSDFIPAAERFGVAAKLDRWIIRTALLTYGKMMATADLKLGLNLSAQTLSDPQLWSFVDDVIAQSQAAANNIIFEITETAAITNFEAAERFVASARQRQCKVSLDDFGAGLSSFEYLRRFPIDSLKIDGSFVQRMETSRFDREIVKAMTRIARGLGYKVIAEKIEKPETLSQLQSMGVELGQGFLLHRPEPLEAVVARRLAVAGAPRAASAG